MFPKFLQIGPFTIYTYGLLTAIGFISGIWLAAHYAEKEGIRRDRVWDLGLIIIIAALVGAKVFMIISDYNYYANNPREIFSLSTLQSGGVFFGGLIFSLIATAWYFRRKNLPGWKVADLFAPGIALGHAIGRLGCFTAGCCYGKPTGVPWAVKFTNPFAHATVGVPLNVPLHPTQLYEALAEFLIFLILLSFRKRKSYDGQVILLYLVLYPLARFVIEFYRGDPDRGSVFHGLLSMSQFIGILVALAAVVALIIRSKKTVPVYGP